ncbi:MAG: nitroreductase family protein [Actinomycetota bacterium]|nr:nitroreductase family protein [Actinomycetota bacterium]
MDAIECIMTRRSIRRYTGEPVARELVDGVLAAAMAAPSAGNQQPWRFIVLDDREVLHGAAGTTPYGRMLEEAAFALVVCADTGDLKHPTMWQQDCSAATQNALLAAHALGLGGVWLGFWPKMERVTPLKELLGIPEGVEPLAVLAFGHPAEEKPPAGRFDPAFVHENRW